MVRGRRRVLQHLAHIIPVQPEHLGGRPGAYTPRVQLRLVYECDILCYPNSAHNSRPATRANIAKHPHDNGLVWLFLLDITSGERVP